MEAVEGGPSPTDTNGVEALGGFSMKSGLLLSIAGGAAASGVAWTRGNGDGGDGAGGEGGVGVGSAGGEEGVTLFLLVTRPSSVISSSSSSLTTWGAFLLGFLKISFFL